MDTDSEKYLDLKGLSEYSSLKIPTLRDYLRDVHPIPHFKLRGKILVRKTDFDAWLEGFRVDQSKMQVVVHDALASLKK